MGFLHSEDQKDAGVRQRISTVINSMHLMSGALNSRSNIPHRSILSLAASEINGGTKFTLPHLLPCSAGSIKRLWGSGSRQKSYKSKAQSRELFSKLCCSALFAFLSCEKFEVSQCMFKAEVLQSHLGTTAIRCPSFGDKGTIHMSLWVLVPERPCTTTGLILHTSSSTPFQAAS